MIWTIRVIACLVLSSITGSILFVFWYFIGQRLEKAGFLNILYIFMKWIMIFFGVPILYIIMGLLDNMYGTYRGDLFLQTKRIMQACNILFVLWIVGLILVLYKQFCLIVQTRKRFKNCFACESQKEELFYKIKENMGIPIERVKLTQAYEATAPVLWGIKKPMVVLPVQNYSEEELKVIFIHELTHYKHHDILWRRIASILVAIYFFNPFIWKIHKLFRKWGEYACDFAACEIAGGVKYYFYTILNIQVKTSGLPSYFTVAIEEDENELLERIGKMKQQKKIKQKSVWKATLICVVMVMASSMTVFAASEGIAKAYHLVYDATVVETEVEMGAELPEYEEKEDVDGIVEEIGEIDNVSRSSKSFDWSVKSGVRKISTEFSAKKGNNITLMVELTPDNKTVRAGIIEPDGNKRYIEGKGSLYRKFTLSKTGKYKVWC